MYRNHPELLTMRGAGVLEVLIDAAIEAWEGIADELMERLSDTMPHRMQAVLRAEGWYTKY